ncbi:MAG TPA: glucosaminidase domain-containing protein [Polyangiaceae bacterium]|nr:glucosaminidase domain-containing protein [Polyangiaceae bacterium]
MVAAILPVNVSELREAPEAKASRAQEAQFKQALDGAAAAPSSGNLVPVVRTQLSAGQAQEALRAAWQNVTGEAPSDKTLALITAQWAHETGNGASMYNYNFAGIKGAGPSGLSVAQHTREGYGASERRIVDNFRAYRSAEEGATDYVQLLSKRFPEAVQGAKDGDPAAFVHGLKAKGYFTGHEGQYLTSVTGIASRYLGQPLEVQGGAPPRIDYGSASGSAAMPVDLQGLYAQMAPPSSDSFVDALSITDQINRAALRAFASSREDS